MLEDPKDRIYDDTNKETFLQLKSLLTCDYYYTISTDLLDDLKKDLLIDDILKNITLMR